MNLNKVSLAQAFDYLDNKAVLVTSTRRLSRHLAEEYGRFQVEKGCLAWETPAVMPFGAWLGSSFFSLPGNDRVLLGREQEETLWEEIIDAAGPEYRFHGLTGISRTAASAMGIMDRYKLPQTGGANLHDREVSSFYSWAREFSRRCKEGGFITAAKLPNYMISQVRSQMFIPPERLILAGFLDFEPIQADLLSVFAEYGTEIHVLEHGVSGAEAGKTRFLEFREEVRTVAEWVLKLMLENPGAEIGVVVPGLEKLRSRVIRVFERVFHPEAIARVSEPENRMFNISLGRPLSDYPLVRCASVLLDLLRKERWTPTEIGTILRSPFIHGGHTEVFARNLLEEKLLKQSRLWISARQVLETASREGSPYYCPLLVQILGQARERLSSQKEEQSPAEWAAFFSNILEAAGWPGERGLNSSEYQTVQAFQEELSRLSRLENVLAAADYDLILEKFSNLLSARMFQPESSGARVHILGLYEASGMEFDHLWVMNMSADQLPAPSRPNPLLPLDQQRSCRVPCSSPDHELESASRITESLACSAKQVIFSFSTHEDDREILESPLIRNIPRIQPDKEPTEKLHLFSPGSTGAALETVDDDHGLPFTDNYLSGGASAFKDQALCPFKGYAVHRLGVRGEDEPSFALSPIDRGSLVHKVLMLVWEEIGSLEELIEMIEQDTLDILIKETAGLAVKEFQKQDKILFTRKFMELESSRLESIVKKWIMHETNRADFEVVALEKDQDVEIDGIRIKTRMDRVDLMDKENVLIIDYKTGSSIEGIRRIWMEQRIVEPQLPIYALTAGKRLAGAVLAQVNPKSCRFHGVVKNEGMLGSDNTLLTPDSLEKGRIQEVLDQWKDNLEAISREIKEGLALADPWPRAREKTCRYCGLMSLCRIREQEQAQ